jgi:hypothetical protein
MIELWTGWVANDFMHRAHVLMQFGVLRRPDDTGPTHSNRLDP